MDQAELARSTGCVALLSMEAWLRRAWMKMAAQRGMAAMPRYPDSSRSQHGMP
jgi:hypothetical protein